METTTQPQPITTVKPPSLMDKGIFLSITRGWPPLSKAVPKDKKKAISNRVHETKDLYSSPELRAVFSHDNKLDDLISRKCLPFSVLKKGVFFVPLDFYNEVEAALSQHAQERIPLVEKVGNVYEAMKEDAKAELTPDGLYDENDYLPKELFLSRFRFRWHYLEFGVADKLKEMDKSVAEREAQKIQEMVMDAGNTFIYILRQQGKEMIDTLVDRLSPAEDGTNKTFHGSTIDKAKEFFENCKKLNVMDDEEFAKLMDTGKKLTEGLTGEQIRSDQALRSSLETGFKKIQVELDAMLVDAPTRMMRFD